MVNVQSLQPLPPTHSPLSNHPNYLGSRSEKLCSPDFFSLLPIFRKIRNREAPSRLSIFSLSHLSRTPGLPSFLTIFLVFLSFYPVRGPIPLIFQVSFSRAVGATLNVSGSASGALILHYYLGTSDNNPSSELINSASPLIH